MGAAAAAEARLEVFGPRAVPGHPAWRELTTWWLSHSAGANTPNWDIAASCDVEGKPGLILVEAKANIPELGVAGKPLAPDSSKNSQENHERIGLAIAEAQAGLSTVLPGIAISHTSHYQLSNRLAFAWKLATLGIPTVLIYLGFTGDQGLKGVGAPFVDDADWQRIFADHLKTVSPTSPLDAPVDAGPAKFWVLSRSRPVLESSPPRA